MKRIPFVRPRLPDPAAWAPRLEESYKQHWFSNFGPVHARFEAELRRRFCPEGRDVTLSSNCTIGLAAALVALEVQGRVAIPSFTFPATAQAVLMAGCQPAYIDADPQNWHMSAEHLSSELASGDISAVIAVRVFGFCIDLSYLEALCRRYSVPLIIDSAASLPGQIRPLEMVGGQGDVEVFSLHATKVFAIGEGGAIMSRRSLRSALRAALNFGICDGALQPRGFNGKLPEVSCGIGLEVLETIQREVELRRAIVNWYRDLFDKLPVQQPGDWAGSPPWQTYPVLMPSPETAELITAEADASGIDLRRYYRPALHRAYPSSADQFVSLPVTDRLAGGMVCFPVLSDMDSGERIRLERLCARIRDFCQEPYPIGRNQAL